MNTPNSVSKLPEKAENKHKYLTHIKDRIRNDVELYGGEVIDSEEMQKAFDQTHHFWSTVGEHTIRVTASSMKICYVLKKLHINVNIPAVVVASLCHDLGMLGRDEKYTSDKECHREHPKDSVAVAREIVSEMPEKTEDIIERHMWPMGPSEAPNSVEGFVVSIADKYNAVKDLVIGSEVNHTGVRHYMSGKLRRIRKTIRKALPRDF
jgi:uncharacterized protein